MGGARRGANPTYTYIESDIKPTDDEPITVPDLDITKPHCFVGAQFFNSIDDSIPAFPTAGLLEIDIQTVNNKPNFEPIGCDNQIKAKEPTTISWAGNTSAVRAKIIEDVVGASHYRLVVTCNEN